MKRALGATIGVAALIVALGAQGAVPRGFQPQWFAAVNKNELWLGGNGTVLHTVDGGRRFTRLPAPPEGEVDFADSRDGFAYGYHSPLYVTHDGGRSWHRLSLRTVLALAAGSGTAYAVTGNCARDGSCSNIRFERSPVSRDAWVSAPIPFPRAVPNFALAVWGSHVWLFGGSGSSSGRYPLGNLLARSTDGGHSFVTGNAPCYADLGAELEPGSSRVLWAFCPTGLQGGAVRSTDGGATFKHVVVPHCCANSTSLGAVSDTVAVLSANAAGTHLLRTLDGGADWRRARTPADVVDWGPFEFVDHRNGFVLVSTRSGRSDLLRTTDAGASWRRVPIQA